MAKIEKIENAKVKVTAPVDSKKWEEAQKAAFKKISKKVEIKGFRKGQAPEAMVKKMVNEQSILLEAAQDIAQETIIEAVKENNIELIDRPSLDFDTLTKDECVLTFICPVKPDVELGQYKGLGYEPKKTKVEDKDVEAELDRIKEQKAELELKEDGTVEKGDTAVIDFEGFKDGVAFDGGKGENYDLEIGSGSFIPGFEDQLIGMKQEEEKEIEVTFPEDYQAEDLKGQKATFKVKVHEIKKKVLPELNEELIKELKIDGVNNLEELKNNIRDNLQKRRDSEAESVATEALLDKLSENAKIDIPEVMINQECENMYSNYEYQMRSQGIDMSQYLKITNSTKEKVMEMFKEDAKRKVKITLVLEEIAKAEKLEVSDDDINKEYEDMANKYSMKVEDVKKYVTEDQIKSDLLLNKAMDFVKSN